MNREDALRRLVNLRDEYGEANLATANEAETRLLIIDEVLLCLGWKKDEFKPETHSAGAGYLDYLLHLEGRPRLVVEAKRVNRTFRRRSELSKVVYRVSYLKTAFGAELSDVIKQAQRYGREEGVPFGIVTNGAEWILLQLVPTPGLKEQKLQAFCFGNILTEEFAFDLFFDLVAKPQVAANVIEKEFAQLNANEAEFCRAPNVRVGPLTWTQPSDETYQHLGEFYRLFFDEITDPGRRHMLERCFVSDSELSQHEAELKHVLKDVAPKYLEDAEELSPGDRADFMPGATGDQKGAVILLVGSVGAGKSTFVTKIMVERRQAGDESIFVVLDLIDEPRVPGPDVHRRFYERVARKWKRECDQALEPKVLRQVFHREIEGFKTLKSEYFEQHPDVVTEAVADKLESLLEDDARFVRRSFRYFRDIGRNIVLVLDNVDRNSEEFQREAYTFAHEVAKRSGATVIVTMRESTFFRGRKQDFLDVRGSDWVFHLQAPDLIRVVSARTQYIQRFLKDDHRYRDWCNRDDGEQFLQLIRRFSKTIKESLLVGHEAKNIRDLLAAVSWHNVREFFKILYRTHRVMGPQQKRWGLSEVVASLGVKTKFETRPSVLPVLYEPPTRRVRGHYLNIRILTLLTKALRDATTRYGVSFRRLNRIMAGFGYSRASVRRATELLVRGRLLECVDIPTEVEQTSTYNLDVSHAFKPSPLGVVMLNRIQFSKPYLTSIAFDLQFQDEDAFHRASRALKDLHDAVEDDLLDRNALSLTKESRAIEEVASYLVDAYYYEQLLGDNYGPEIEIVEEHVLEVVLPKLTALGAVREDEAGEAQTSLFEESSDAHVPIDLQVPQNINDLRIGRSEYGPKILWALAAMRTIGEYAAFGVRITEVINQHLVDYPVAPNNVSRALRGKTMQRQEWLQTQVDGHRPKYGLAEGWREAWNEVFGEEAPF